MTAGFEQPVAGQIGLRREAGNLALCKEQQVSKNISFVLSRCESTILGGEFQKLPITLDGHELGDSCRRDDFLEQTMLKVVRDCDLKMSADTVMV